MADLKTYTFDTNARIEFDVEAFSADEAAEQFKDAIRRAGREYGGMDITPDSYQPLEKDEPLNVVIDIEPDAINEQRKESEANAGN